MGLFGAGKQAATQLAAVVAARPVRKAFVYSRNEPKRAAFAEVQSAALGIEVVPVDRPQDAVEELPIVVTATTSREPVFAGEWLEEGAFVAAVGSNWLDRAEIDDATIRRADRIVCDSVEACRHEAGDFQASLERGTFDWRRAANLADVVAGKAVGRCNLSEISLFKSVGLALEDIALAAKVVELASGRGIGRTIELG
jgi:ornithine cyclodeaminase/alanine dehydrogenase